MGKSNHRVKGLGEASIRVWDLPAMQKFYEEVIGLEVLDQGENQVFFKIAEGYAGHTQNLALFRADNRMFLVNKFHQLDPEGSTLHHIALNIDLEDFESEKKRLEGFGLKVVATTHEWLHVRSLYFPDTEGNLLELVAYDANVRDAEQYKKEK